jgi:glycerophosphoryl diester phosphodiesterase
MREFIFFAHRGSSGDEPENTLLSVHKALSHGAKWIEIDIYAVGNVPVVIHDKRLERTTNGSGYVTRSSLEYLRSLDAGKGEKIPFLREVFDMVGQRAGINVELKGKNCAAPVVSLIEEYICKHEWTYDRLLVSSFSRRELKQVGAIQPKIRRGLNLKRFSVHSLRTAEQLGAWSIHLGINYLSSQVVEKAHAKGLKVFVFTVNRADEIERLRLMGVDGVFTDYPELAFPRSPKKL